MHSCGIPALKPLDELRQQRAPLPGEVVAGDDRQRLAELRAHQRGRGQHEPCQQPLDLLLHSRQGKIGSRVPTAGPASICHVMLG